MDRPFCVCMPVVLVASVVGVIVSLVQALTQIQDQTLQFMIKLAIGNLQPTLMVSHPWLSGILLNYTRQIMLRIGSMVEWHNR